MKTISIIILFGLLSGCSDPVVPQETVVKQVQETQLTQYKTATSALVEQIKANHNTQEIELQAQQLVNLSKGIIDDFLVVYPQCEAYLSALKQAADTIPTLPLADIESGYHADGRLPAFSDPNCYHAKDLLVHPATVQAIAKLGFNEPHLREQAQNELIEVLAHFSQVEMAIKKHSL
ncbi:hypothetical protein [Pseudoalteromonas tunicata]|uniref:Uncharacterized protein n=1 Tax=Pseudoalteromonas tunicata D2 TaxID=87626 RepID=A4C7I3_9GAMM|nr:hypothetical protein [Pseudoalteromonas tunicata]ATC95907.1 hypothetical protein PTUN_a3606 [Pseudoalteromonas tunicata]AXT31449.1 hypothetical protein D1819_11870 [Pseudoalteromonas tunicata]EAR29937.1 hypothetical protein PTD2_13994 [Pseudoalteromonas tunicata D2]